MTCVRGKEGRSVSEMYDILEEVRSIPVRGRARLLTA